MPENQQQIAEDRARDRCLDQVDQPGAKRDCSDDQLGEVAHGGAQHAADRRTRVLGHRLSRGSQDPRQRHDRRGAQDEDGDWRCPKQPREDGDRDED